MMVRSHKERVCFSRLFGLPKCSITAIFRADLLIFGIHVCHKKNVPKDSPSISFSDAHAGRLKLVSSIDLVSTYKKDNDIISDTLCWNRARPINSICV